jgi:hypothetical protein
MDKAVKQDLQVQLILLGASLIGMYLLYQWLMLPDWKREMLRNTFRSQFAQLIADGKRMAVSPLRKLTIKDEMEIRKFREEIAEWNHNAGWEFPGP